MTLIIFLAVLAILILTHEFGHFIFAKLSGVKVEEFGLGFPPRILGFQFLRGKIFKEIEKEKSLEVEIDTLKVGEETLIKEKITEGIQEVGEAVPVKKRRFIFWNKKPIDEESKNLEAGTVYSLNLIPFGGFVKIYGEEAPTSRPEASGVGVPTSDAPSRSVGRDKGSFSSQRLYVRALILAAGVLFNLLFAWPVLTTGYLIGAPVSIENNEISGGNITNKGVIIVQVQENTPAEAAGLKEGDYLLEFVSKNGEILKVSDVKSVQDFIAKYSGTEIQINYLRGGKEFSVKATPVIKPEANKGNLGIAMDYVATIKFPFFRAVWEGLKSTVQLTLIIAKTLISFFYDLISKREMVSQVSGPVGIVGFFSSAMQSGFIFVLRLIALLSINLALINIVPFPALDGGRLLFLLLEFIKGKPISQKAANIANNIGFAILIILMIVITYRDILKIIR
jgi:regulator of sigma E protease